MIDKDDTRQDEAFAKDLDELFNIQKIKAARPDEPSSEPNDKEG